MNSIRISERHAAEYEFDRFDIANYCIYDPQLGALLWTTSGTTQQSAPHGNQKLTDLRKETRSKGRFTLHQGSALLQNKCRSCHVVSRGTYIDLQLLSAAYR